MNLISKDLAPTAPAVCATFTLTPYSLSASGTQTQAGSAVTIAGTSAGVTPILGCVHTPGVSPDWRYLVTATNFAGCTSTIAGITPAIETFTVDVTCTPGQDVSAQVIAQVSIPVANDAGYIDIGVGVNVSTPQSGCKMADIDSNGQLHFGQSFVETTGGPTPSAYTGIGVFTPPATSGPGAAASSVHQFVGSVFSGTQSDAFFTGLFTLPAAPQTTTLVQAFTQACPAGQMTIQPHAVECVTQATLPSSTNTQVQVADVFASWPGRAAVSASITNGSTITLNTSLAGQHLGSLPSTTGYDNLTNTQAMAFADVTVIGLYGSLVHSDELLALVSSATQGILMVPLNLDEATGLWAAGPQIPLSTLSLAKQQQIGLFGPGGCYPDPIPACTDTNGRPQRKLQLVGNAPPTLSGTLNISVKDGNGNFVTAANPALASQAAPISIHLQWSVSGLSPGQYAYPTVTLCTPVLGFSNTNGGQYIAGGPTCTNGVDQPQASSRFAFPPIVANAAGGVTQDLQFTVSAADFVTDVSTWELPFALYAGASATPDPANDIAIAESSGVTGATIHLKEIHDRLSQVFIETVTPVAGGLNFRLLYLPSTFSRSTLGYGPHYLEGHSIVELSPPTLTNGLVATLVPGSAVSIGGWNPLSNPNLPPVAIADRQLNTNATLSVTPDAVHGGIPMVDVDNLIATCCNSGAQGIEYTADWFVPTPTQQGTTITVQGAITWNGTTDRTATATTLDISPVPLAELRSNFYHFCGDDFLGQQIVDSTYLDAQYNSGQYQPDGTFNAAGGPAPTYPAHLSSHGPGSCSWMFNWRGEYYALGQRSNGSGNDVNATFINPDYILKISPDEHIYTTLNEQGLGASWTISSSDSPACDNTNINDAALWTEASTTPGRTDWSAVRCARYQYAGVTESPGLSQVFRTRLNSSITTGAAIGQLRFTTAFFWVTADNVLPDAANNVWGMNWLVTTWDNTTFLEIYQGPDQNPVAVNTPITSVFTDAHAAGVSVPDLIFTYTIAPGAVYTFDTAHPTPESWFIDVPTDDNGAKTVPHCTIAGQVATCTLTSPTGAGIPGQGGPFTNSAAAFPMYKFLPEDTFNGEKKPRSVTIASSAAWLSSGGVPIQFGAVDGSTHYDTVIGPNSLFISKDARKSTTVSSGGTVPFYITYGAQGLNSGQLGAGGVAVFDFIGRDFQPGLNGAAGTLVAQPSDCVTPIATHIVYMGTSGPAQPTQGPDFYTTTDASPGITAATAWTLVPSSGLLPAGTTGIKIIPYSSKGAAGVLLPVDGNAIVQVAVSAPAGSTGRVCNSAALTATLFQPTATQEATVTILPPCDPNPWGATAQQR